MLPEELISLINDIRQNGSEDNRIEIKKAAGGCPKLYDTLSSFSNQPGGGIIVFGIDQYNDFDLCGVYDADDLQKKHYFHVQADDARGASGLYGCFHGR